MVYSPSAPELGGDYSIRLFGQARQASNLRLSVLTCAILFALATPFATPSTALAADDKTQPVRVQQRNYKIPSGKLTQVLSRFAGEAGVVLIFDGRLTKDAQSTGVKGRFSVVDGFAKLLLSSGLAAIKRSDGTFTIERSVKPTDDEVSLSAVRVLGEKFNRSLDQTLSSVSVQASHQLENHHDNDIKDVMTRTPGVYSTPENFGIRGVPLQGLGEGSSDAISVYFDGVPQSNRAVTFMRFPTWDMQQIEIYRGSQSINQGRNSIAGSVLLKSNDPSFEREGKLRVKLGQYGKRGASIVLGGPLSDRVAAYRIVADFEDEDGYLFNETLNKHANPKRTVVLRNKLLLRPTDSTDILLTAFHATHRQGNQTNDQTDADKFDDKVFTNIDTQYKIRRSGGSIDIDHDFNEVFSLKAITSFNDTPFDSLLDFNQDPSPRDDIIFVDQNDRTLGQEIRLGFERESVKGHLGLFYNRSEQRKRYGYKLSATDFFESPAILNFYPDGYRWQRDIVDDTEITNRALFFAADYQLSKALTISGGARYDSERQVNVTGHETYGVTPLNGLDAGTDATLSGLTSSNPNRTTHARYSALLPNLGIDYQFSSGQHLGLVAKRGYRGGGVTYNRATNSAAEFNPEYNDTLELTYRGELMRSQLGVRANVYYTKWRDQQVTFYTDPNDDFSSQVGNLGSSTSRGAEVELRFAANRILSLVSAVAYSDTSFDQYVNDLENLSGYGFESAPKWKIALGAQLQATPKLMLAVNAVYQSDSVNYYEFDDDGQVSGQFKNDSYTLVNMNLRYRLSKAVFLTAYAKNVLNKRYVTSAREGRDVDVGEPRHIGVALNMRF